MPVCRTSYGVFPSTAPVRACELRQPSACSSIEWVDRYRADAQREGLPTGGESEAGAWLAKLDNEGPTGWVRTGFQFNAYAAPNGNSAPVCRFFSVAFAPKSSHFYTPFAAECSLRQTDPAWMLESADAFDIGIAAADGSCDANLTPVYRLYNNGQGGAPNHRYTTNAGVRANMIGQGWVPEGLGPNGVEMCSPL